MIEEDIQVLVARVSTNGSCAEQRGGYTSIIANPSGEEHVTNVRPIMGLHVEHDHSTLVALGKKYKRAPTIHNVLYADDVVRVSVEKVYNEVQYVMQTLHTFIALLRHLVKLVSHEIRLKKHDEPIHRLTIVSGTDPLLDLIQNMSDLYEKPLEMLWNGTQFGIPDLWMIFMKESSSRLGCGQLYGFLKPQSIHNAKDRCDEAQNYIETWVKESQREVYLGPYLNHPNEMIASKRLLDRANFKDYQGYYRGYSAHTYFQRLTKSTIVAQCF
ncbi:hypothetical protein glysoja_047220 [Glycine soja]|uniref:Uncharacterized protein n=1 Tax=Glycine soja TaxID=3848 RepID=A0A0B2RT41_GLYSO|nr:hypothetical protein glysoja_047220 [Glycine soja]